MKVELVRLKAVRYDEVEQEFDLWQVFATGGNGNRVYVADLSFNPKYPLMLKCNQPMSIVKELVDKCAAITGREVLPPFEIVMPPEIDNGAGEDDDADDEEQDDNS